MISLWDLSHQKIKINLQGHSTLITAMSIYRKNSVPCALASASAEGKIKLWDLKSKSAATNFKGHFAQIDSLSFSPDFTYLASGAQDGTVKLWDIRMTNKSLKEINGQEQKAINCIEFNPGAIAFAYGSKDKTIRYWDLNKFVKIGQTTSDRLPIQKLAFDNNGKNLFCATDEALKYWSVSSRGLSLIDMFDTGWNKLQSFMYVEGRFICALSTFSNKISYYLLKYKDLLKSPNMHLRANPNMGDISEVQENEDSTFFEADQEDNLIPKTPLQSKGKTPKKSSGAPGALKPEGFSKFINEKSAFSNVSVSLTDVSSSKIENESVFIKNALNMIGPNNYKGKLGSVNNRDKIYKNHDDVPLPRPSDSYFDDKKKVKKENVNDNRNLLGDISNITMTDDGNETKGNLTLNAIFGTNQKAAVSQLEDEIPAMDFDEGDLDAFFGKKEGEKGTENENKLEISAIQNSGEGEETFLDGPIFNTTKRSMFGEFFSEENKGEKGKEGGDNNNNNNNSNNNLITGLRIDPNNLEKVDLNKLDLSVSSVATQNQQASKANESFASLKSNETIGLDINQFMNENLSLNETVHSVPQSNDLPILQEINAQHDNLRKAITKRYNSLKMVGKWWTESNIPSALNALSLMKDSTVTKDFFNYAIINRDDISKIPFNLDCGLDILPHIKKLMKSKYDVYWKCACKVGMILLKILMERIVMTKQTYKNCTPIQQTDPIIESRLQKCDEIIKIFKDIYQSKTLKAHVNKAKNEGKVAEEDVANAFYTDLEFFLKPFGEDKINIVNVN